MLLHSFAVAMHEGLPIAVLNVKYRASFMEASRQQLSFFLDILADRLGTV